MTATTVHQSFVGTVLAVLAGFVARRPARPTAALVVTVIPAGGPA